jgi:outer membrane receptor for ferrienterochelin and colicins
MKRSLLAVSIASSCCCSAAAQTVDHAALEQLFGEPVTTSVTGSPQRASDVPASMEIISADDIRRSGARDLPTLLRHVAGVDVMQTTMSHGDVGIRGYNQAFSPRLLVLLDGRQVYADFYGYTPWDTIPIELEAIRQIEVVRGPNAALFGFNAVGGVINIISYGPAEDVPGSATAIAGTQDLRQLSAVSGWKIGDGGGLRLSVGRRDNDDFATPGVGSWPTDSREAVNVAGGFQIGERVNATFEATNSDASHTEINPSYLPAFVDYETDSLKAQVAAETRLGLVQGSFYVNDLSSVSLTTLPYSPVLSADSEVRVGQLGSLSKLGPDHTLRVALERREDEIVTTPISGADVFYSVNSISAMWEWKIADTLTLTNAVRRDQLDLGRSGFIPPGFPFTNADWDRSIGEASFNSGVVWRTSDVDVLRFTVSRGVQLPNLINLGGVVVQLPFGYYTGVPTIQPTIVTNYEASWSRDLAGLGAKLRVAAFRGRTREIVASSGGVDFARGLFGFPVNIGDSRVSGVEIAIDGEHENWRWSASYTPLEIDDEFAPAFTVTNTQIEFEHTAPEHVLNGSLGWSRGPWEIDGYLRYQSSFEGIMSPDIIVVPGVLVPIPSYVSVDGRLGYRFNDRMGLALASQGLTSKERRETAAGGPVERRILATFRVMF